MRLVEFEQPSPIRVAAQEYAAKGFKKIARGASAIVLSDGKTIVKIGPKSDCWLNFAQKAKSASNPHLPKIYDIQMIGNHYLAQVELLYHVPDNFFKTSLYRKIASWLVVNANWKTPRDVYLGEFTPAQIGKMSRTLDIEEQQIVDALRLIKDTRGSCNYDLHPDNIMKRKNGTIVMNDPLTHQG